MIIFKRQMYIISVLILTIFISVFVYGTGNINYSEIKKVLPFYKNASIIIENERNNIILGFWNFGFPVSSGSFGYIFLKTGEFIYFDASTEGEGSYYGTYGKWKEQNYRLYLLPVKNFLNKDDDSYYATKSQYKDWQLASDLRSYDCYWYPTEKEDDYYPNSISIKEFQDGKITDYVQRYFKMGSQKQFEKLVQDFREMKIK